MLPYVCALRLLLTMHSRWMAPGVTSGMVRIEGTGLAAPHAPVMERRRGPVVSKRLKTKATCASEESEGKKGRAARPPCSSRGAAGWTQARSAGAGKPVSWTYVSGTPWAEHTFAGSTQRHPRGYKFRCPLRARWALRTCAWATNQARNPPCAGQMLRVFQGLEGHRSSPRNCSAADGGGRPATLGA